MEQKVVLRTVTTSLKSANTRNMKSSQLLYRITEPKESVISFFSILSDFMTKVRMFKNVWKFIQLFS